MLTDIGASEKQFVLAAKKGLKSKENRKYFEQLIACDNYLYFKNMMVKKNLQLDEQAYKLLHENMVKKVGMNLQTIIKNDKDYQKHQEKKEKLDKLAELEMNKVVDEEQQKLVDLKEFEDIKKAFEFGKKKDMVVKDKPPAMPVGGDSGVEKKDKPVEEEISLFNNNIQSKFY